MKNRIIILGLMLLTSCYTVSRVNILNDSYYENLLHGPTGGYLLKIPIISNDSLFEIIISYEDIYSLLNNNNIKNRRCNNLIFKAVKYNKRIQLSDSINYYNHYLIKKNKEIDNILDKGFQYFKNYFVDNDILVFNKKINYSENKIGYILSIFIKNKYYIYEDENCNIILSKTSL
jgi:hypothetical protein